MSRISDKINEIHSNIEKGKVGKLEEYNRKVTQLEDKFDDAIDASESKFKIIDEQLMSISQYLQKDQQNKDEVLRRKKEELAQREVELSQRFEQAAHHRKDIEGRMQKLIDRAANDVHQDIVQETRNRNESIEHIKSCLKGDFPKLEEMVKREIEEKIENQA